MPVRDDLGVRMKEFYEQIPKTKLMRRTPVAIRIDGKAFHTFTRGFQKPFDIVLMKSMQETMQYLCKNIQGCVFGYTQSDEITLILVDYKELDTSAWFDYEVQKLCSISASMATMAFNKFFADAVEQETCGGEYLEDIAGKHWGAMQKGINWNDFPVDCKRGAACIRVNTESDDTIRCEWKIDKNMPMLKGDDRDYLDKLIYVGE